MRTELEMVKRGSGYYTIYSLGLALKDLLANVAVKARCISQSIYLFVFDRLFCVRALESRDELMWSWFEQYLCLLKESHRQYLLDHYLIFTTLYYIDHDCKKFTMASIC